MKLCHYRHDEVCFDDGECPCCQLLDEIKDNENEINNLQNEVSRLETEIEELKSSI